MSDPCCRYGNGEILHGCRKTAEEQGSGAVC